MSQQRVRGTVARFEGPGGWTYLPLSKRLSSVLAPLVRSTWPALLKAECTLGKTVWTASIMPIKDGPLFIALPAKVRKAEKIEVGQRITVTLALDL